MSCTRKFTVEYNALQIFQWKNKKVFYPHNCGISVVMQLHGAPFINDEVKDLCGKQYMLIEMSCILGKYSFGRRPARLCVKITINIFHFRM